ncbi:c-type cytochrome biogenesis protein CcmI [Nitrosococcus oceani]|uniref:Cytochrome c biogenesis factor n=2 Tax=Nitrosococcus oceani TaxID=1229 RepID=Q3JCJ4_NITOC|nr:c-type cytochrome biogenesis protein CcmI [Nitrosococcus oceani]KFI20145.1 cytochrome C biogenesis protein [Nitrosococcus oceani C-27]ABA57452.1 Cytochrome c biogenesis factor [Nitrosococcus oceani ATCC 19707]EDZ67110.1 cytochrome c-type biogenesis protein CcmI [Nitrosococcus oceani AFC27]KFI23257.1 cytochrome C biogenesis protein [Nitrosococcus oceani]GEM21425.1 c-type cytochrome biogenesis protein CcmI [Nitrosococcus oceani]
MTSLSIFWIAAGIMVLLALSFLLPPLLRRHNQQVLDETTAEIAIYRERLRELRAELRNGTLNEEQFALARRELEEAMAADLATGSTPSTELKPKRHWITALFLLLLTPSLAFVAYQQLGASDQVARFLAMEEGSQQEMDTMRHAMEGLKARLAEHPEDVRGWQLLGRTYLATNEFAKASEALGRAYTLDDQNPDVILDYAEALAASQGRRLQGAPLKLVHRALELAPQHPKALWLAAVNALQTNQDEEAKSYLQRLASQLPPGSEEERMVRAHLAQLAPEMAAGGATTEARVTTEARAPATTTNTEEGDTPAPRIEVKVALDPALQGEVSESSTVFVFARAAKGPPMPLAAARHQVKDLPLTVVLNDSMAMMPSMKMSNFSEFQVGARVSWSGNPVPQSGDFEGFAEGIIPATSSKPVSVVINQRVP